MTKAATRDLRRVPPASRYAVERERVSGHGRYNHRVLIGSELARVRIVASLGEGGVGEVCSAVRRWTGHLRLAFDS